MKLRSSMRRGDKVRTPLGKGTAIGFSDRFISVSFKKSKKRKRKSCFRCIKREDVQPL